MAMVVKNNMSAVSTLNTLNKNSNALQKSLSKVSSGMKINSAQDDASGYAISERMRVQIRSLDQANQNTQNGSSMMKTAEGAVSSTVEILKSLKEKAINAANDTNKDSDRTTIQKEIDQFIDQIDDNALTTFNGKYLVDGSKSTQGSAVATALTNQSLATNTTGGTALTDLSNRNGESLEIAKTDYVTASYVMDGYTYSTKMKVEDKTIDQVLGELNKVSAGSSTTKSKEELQADVDKAAQAIKDAVAATDAYKKDAKNGAAVDAWIDAATTPDSYGEMPGLTADFAAPTGTGEWVVNDTDLATDSAAINGAVTADMKTALSDAITAYNKVAADTEKKAAAATVASGTDADFKAITDAGTDADKIAALSDDQKKLAKALQTLGTTGVDDMKKAAEDAANAEFKAKLDAKATDYNNGGVFAYKKGATAGTQVGTGNYSNGGDNSAIHSAFATTVEGFGAADIEDDIIVANKNNDKTSQPFTVDGTGLRQALLASAAATVATDAANADAYKAAEEEETVTAIAGGAGGGIAGGKIQQTGSMIGTSAAGDQVDTADGTEGLTIYAKNPGLTNQIAAVNFNIVDSEGNVKKSANAALDNFTTSIYAKNKSAANELTFQVGASANQAIAVSLDDMRSKALGLIGPDGTKVSVATQDKANAAVNVFDNAIQKALDQQTTIGAIEARLEYTSQNLTTSSENVQAAESTIRDADMAKEMTNYTKNNVLLQAAQSMLAQANQSSSAVLSLLQ